MKYRRFYFWWLTILSAILPTISLFGEIHNRLPDIRSIGTGGNGVIQTAYVNPAILSLETYKSVRFQYYNAYGLRELGTISGGFHYPNDWLPTGFHFASFGYDAYRETMLRLAAGKQLGEQWAIGVSVECVMLQTALYDEQQTRLATDLGILFIPSDYWQMGLVVLHAPSISLGDQSVDSKQLTPLTVQTGFSWKLIDKMTLMGSLQIQKECVTAAAGLEYTLYDTFFLRAGIQTQPLLPCFGLGYTYSLFTVDIAVISHPVLGMQTGLGLTVTF